MNGLTMRTLVLVCLMATGLSGCVTTQSGTAIDRLRPTAASHAAATLAGSAATNPLTLSGQQFGFDIGQLTAAP